MDEKKVIDTLSDLLKLDIDATRAYEQAIENIKTNDVRERLIGFRGDHERHVNDLSAAIRRLGGKPPERTPDLKGFFIEGFTAIRAAIGEDQAIKAMHGNEQLTRRKYGDALSVEMPPDVRDIVQRGHQDEERHFAYIDDKVSK